MNKTEINHAIRNYLQRTRNVETDLKAAFIDLDGTLYDSMPGHAQAWHRMMKEIGVETDVDEFFGYEGMTGKATINLLFERAFGRHATDDEAIRLYRRKTLYFHNGRETQVMPGAQEMVACLRDNNIVTVLVSGTGQPTLLNRLDDDFNRAFPENLRITAHNVKHGKPHPEPYLKALELTDVEPRQAIVIENAPLGVRAGVDAGIFTIAVNTGPLPIEALRSADADLVFKSMRDFADTLPQLIDALKR